MYLQMTELERDKLAIIDEKAEIATEVIVLETNPFMDFLAY